jgi:hypothetical protein
MTIKLEFASSPHATENMALRNKSKDWLTRNHNNVSSRASTIKIQISMLV